MSLSGKSAFITGGAAGIGFAIARTLGREGASIALADVDAAAGDDAARRLRDEGINCLAVECDVSDAEVVAQSVNRAAEALGGLGILVNNAGLHLSGYTLPVTQLDTAQWRKLFDVNVLGIVNCARACRPVMRAGGGGVIINIASMAGFKALNAYGVSKLAVRGLTVALAHELAGDGIRVCGVAPGLVDSDSVMEGFPQDRRDDYVSKVQLVKRLGKVEDVAAAVRFLCSDEASFITAETLVVSGGALPRI